MTQQPKPTAQELLHCLDGLILEFEQRRDGWVRYSLRSPGSADWLMNEQRLRCLIAIKARLQNIA